MSLLPTIRNASIMKLRDVVETTSNEFSVANVEGAVDCMPSGC